MKPRLLAAAVSLAALLVAPGRGGADDEGVPPLRGWTRGLFLAGGGGSVGGLDFGGFGLDFEAARGLGRWQLYGEGQVAWASLSPPHPIEAAAAPMANVNGLRVRIGAGARAIVRSMRPDASAAIEMYVEAGPGVERFWWNGGGVLTRPDLGFGGGMQVRALRSWRGTIRLGLEVLVAAPVTDASSTVACHGSCQNRDTGTESQFVTNFGATW